MQRQLRRTQAFLGRVNLRGWLLVSGMKMQCRMRLSALYAFHWWSAHCTASMLLSDELMSCCGEGTSGSLDLRHFVSALDGWVSAQRSMCPGSMLWRARDRVAPLWWSSAGWTPEMMGRLSAGVGCRQPVAIRKVLLKDGMSTAAPDRRALLCGWMHQD